MEVGTGDDLVNRPQSLAGVKLSGCKNATPAVCAGTSICVRLPKWGVEASTAAEVPSDVTHLGVRAFFLERADGPGRNCYRVRVDRVSDSRFDRTVLLGFVDRAEDEVPTVDADEDEMKYLHQHLFWRVDKLEDPGRPAAVRRRGAVGAHPARQGVSGLALSPCLGPGAVVPRACAIA